MKSLAIIFSFICVVLVGVLVFGSLFVTDLGAIYAVDQREQVILKFIGKPGKKIISEAGLHFKFPFFLHSVHRFEKRILQWDGEAERIPTKDKRYIWVDTTARWKIVDPLKFMTSFPLGEINAKEKLSNIFKNKVREVISQHNVIEMIRSTNQIMENAGQSKFGKENSGVASKTIEGAEGRAFEGDSNKLERIRKGKGRDVVKEEILKRAKKDVLSFGIELIDIRIKRINYDRDVRRKVYDRMISERDRASNQFLSEGEGKKSEIKGLTNRDLQRIESEAIKQAEIIRGKADAEAIKIYAEAYSKDPDYYSFLLSLESYKKALANDTTLILSMDSDYLKYLKTSDPSEDYQGKVPSPKMETLETIR